MRQLIKAWFRLWASALDVVWAWLVFKFFSVLSTLLKKLYDTNRPKDS